MALIEYRINRDSSGNITIVNTIQRIGPEDEIVVITDTPNTALQWIGVSPFAEPADRGIYRLPLAETYPQGLRATRSIDLAQEVGLCGEVDAEGNFKPWLAGGGGFPGRP